MLSHRAYIEVLLPIIEHVRLMERILQELALHLLVEHVVFHVWSRAASFISGFDFADIEVIKDSIYSTDWMIFRYEVTNAWWKKKIIVLSVPFI